MGFKENHMSPPIKLCKVCGESKPAVKGSWVTLHDKPVGNVCLKCNAARCYSGNKKRQSTATGKALHKQLSSRWQAENLAKAKIKLDSSTAALNAVKVQEKMTDEKGDVEGILSKIKNLEEKKVEILTKVDALNSIKNSVGRNIDDLININN